MQQHMHGMRSWGSMALDMCGRDTLPSCEAAGSVHGPVSRT